MDERRSNHRFRVAIPVSLYLRDQQNHLRMLDTFCRDVSTSGAFIEMDEPLERGDEVRMVMHFAHRYVPLNQMAGLGRVVRKEARGVAVEFDKVQQVSIRGRLGVREYIPGLSWQTGVCGA